MSKTGNIPVSFRFLLALSPQARHIWHTQCQLVTKLLAEVDLQSQARSMATDWVLRLDEENRRVRAECDQLRAEVDELHAKKEEYRALCTSLANRLAEEQPIGPGFQLPLHAN